MGRCFVRTTVTTVVPRESVARPRRSWSPLATVGSLALGSACYTGLPEGFDRGGAPPRVTVELEHRFEIDEGPVPTAGAFERLPATYLFELPATLEAPDDASAGAVAGLHFIRSDASEVHCCYRPASSEPSAYAFDHCVEAPGQCNEAPTPCSTLQIVPGEQLAADVVGLFVDGDGTADAAGRVTLEGTLEAEPALGLPPSECDDEGSTSNDDDGTESDDDTASSGDTDTDTGDPGCVPAAADDALAVPTEQGAIVGIETDGVRAFLGVPYAAPPVGDLRFRPPERPACRETPLPTTALPPACPQLDSESGPVVGDEDCLYLNVWTPDPEATDLPVFVFVHGGGHALGNGGERLFDGANLAREQNIVVVTIDYRLGALGYLAHPALDAEDSRGTSGNYGLLDQRAALGWVRANAASFGGDPTAITIGGQSAGAVSACALLAVDGVADEVGGAILQSGACMVPTREEYLASVGEPWVANSPCASASDLLGCLRSLSIDEVIGTEPTGFPDVSSLQTVWSPFVDGVVLPESPLLRLESGVASNVAVLVGATAQETGADAPPLSLAEFQSLVQQTFESIATDVLQAYPVSAYPSPAAAWTALVNDVKYLCNARRSAAAAVQGGSDAVFRYHFAFEGPDADPEGSAFHGLDLVYLFGNFDGFGSGSYEPTETDLAMRDAMQLWWGNHMRGAAPSSPALTWPAYVIATDPYARLDVPGSTGQGIRTTQCDFWDAFVLP